MRNLTNKQLKLIAVIAIVILSTAIGAWVAYSMLTFRLTGTTPKLSGVSNISPFIDIHFSKKISLDDLSVKSDSIDITGFENPDGKTLRVYIEELSIDSTYTLTIEKILSQDGKELRDKNLTFDAKDIPFEKFSKAQKQAILKHQDRTDNIKSDPILSHVPYGGLHFQLTANSDGDKLVLTAELRLSAADAKINQAAAVEAYKKEVVDYIKSKGIDPTKYTIEYKVIQPSIY